MLPVHYAAFFNSASVIRVLLKASGSKGSTKKWQSYEKIVINVRVNQISHQIKQPRHF